MWRGSPPTPARGVSLGYVVRYRIKYLDLETKGGHAFTVFLHQLFALACRFAVLLDVMAKLEKAVVARRFGFRACAAAIMLDNSTYGRIP